MPEECIFEPLTIPRSRKTPSQCSVNSQAFRSQSVADMYRPMYFSVNDVIVTEFKERFAKRDLEIVKHLQSLLFAMNGNFSTEEI